MLLVEHLCLAEMIELVVVVAVVAAVAVTVVVADVVAAVVTVLLCGPSCAACIKWSDLPSMGDFPPSLIFLFICGCVDWMCDGDDDLQE